MQEQGGGGNFGLKANPSGVGRRWERVPREGASCGGKTIADDSVKIKQHCGADHWSEPPKTVAIGELNGGRQRWEKAATWEINGLTFAIGKNTSDSTNSSTKMRSR